jgi:hypothetical protein
MRILRNVIAMSWSCLDMGRWRSSQWPPEIYEGGRDVETEGRIFIAPKSRGPAVEVSKEATSRDWSSQAGATATPPSAGGFPRRSQRGGTWREDPPSPDWSCCD